MNLANSNLYMFIYLSPHVFLLALISSHSAEAFFGLPKPGIQGLIPENMPWSSAEIHQKNDGGGKSNSTNIGFFGIGWLYDLNI